MRSEPWDRLPGDTPRYICDCGQVYTERAAVRECQAAGHSAAAGNELADAEEACRRAGYPVEYGNDERP
jgi:hypothetical protein